MDEQRLGEIRARLLGITPGEWQEYTDVEGFHQVAVTDDNWESYKSICGIGDLEETTGEDHRNAGFIAHAPADLRDVLADNARLVAERDALAAEMIEAAKWGVQIVQLSTGKWRWVKNDSCDDSEESMLFPTALDAIRACVKGEGEQHWDWVTQMWQDGDYAPSGSGDGSAQEGR